MTDLIIGADGIIGRNLYNKLKKNSTNVVGTTRRREVGANQYFNISDPIINLNTSFEKIYNCVGITSLTECNNSPDYTYNINVDLTIKYLRKFHEAGSSIVYLSSNAVFDGLTSMPGVNSMPTPVTEYGRQKVQIEQQVLALGERTCIIRLTKVISCHLPLIRSWIKCLKSGTEIFPFADLYLSPISLDFATNAITNRSLNGIIHISGDAQLSYYQLAIKLAEALKLPLGLVRAVNSSESELSIIYRPLYTSLDMTDTAKRYGIFGQAVRSVIDDLVEEYMSM